MLSLQKKFATLSTFPVKNFCTVPKSNTRLRLIDVLKLFNKMETLESKKRPLL